MFLLHLRHVSGTEMSTHVSVIFKSGRFRCCSFPLCFRKRIFNILVESLQRKQWFCASYYFDEIETLGNYNHQ